MEGIESLSKSKVRVLRGAEKAVAAIQGQRYNFEFQAIFLLLLIKLGVYDTWYKQICTQPPVPDLQEPWDNP